MSRLQLVARCTLAGFAFWTCGFERAIDEQDSTPNNCMRPLSSVQADLEGPELLRSLELQALNGNRVAQAQLAFLSLYSEDYPYDPIGGAYWLLKASEQGCADAQLLFALSYESGPLPADRNRMIWWLHNAEVNGSAEASAALAGFERQPRFQLDMSPITPEMRAWYRHHAESGNAWASWRMANLAQTTDEALTWLHSAADGGVQLAYVTLGHVFSGYTQMGTAGEVIEDHQAAISYYTIAAESGDSFAMNRLAEMHYFRAEEGGDSQSADAYEAVRWYRSCAEQGDYTCLPWLAHFLRTGYGGAEVDEALAAELEARAAEAGPLSIPAGERARADRIAEPEQ